MSAGGASRLSANGRYGTVGFSGGQTAPMGQVKQVDETTRRRELVDTEQLSEEFREAIEADHFLVYGKASVEQFDEDDPPQKLTMEALADALPQLYDDGIISRRHKDVPIGEVVPEHTLEESTEVEVGDETFAFEAGDTLETHIDEEGEEFWIVADIANTSEIAKDTRLRALTGELDGFSVTIYAKEWETTDAGEVVTELDWHAVTIGRDDQIKNKESRFGVAEFKALFGASSDGALAGGISTIRHEAQKTMEDTFSSQLFSKAGQEFGFDQSRLEAAAAFREKAEAEDGNEELDEKAKSVAEEHDIDDPKAVVELANRLTGEKADMSEDVVQVLDAVEEEMGEEARDVLEGAIGSGGGGDTDAEEAKEGELKGDDEEDDEDDAAGKADNEDDDEDTKSVPDNVVTDDQLDAKLDERVEELRADLKSDVEDSIEDLGDQIEETTKAAVSEAVPSIVEDTAEKMATGSTDDPAQGSTQNQVDYAETIKSSFGGGEGGEA